MNKLQEIKKDIDELAESIRLKKSKKIREDLTTFRGLIRHQNLGLIFRKPAIINLHQSLSEYFNYLTTVVEQTTREQDVLAGDIAIALEVAEKKFPFLRAAPTITQKVKVIQTAMPAFKTPNSTALEKAIVSGWVIFFEDTFKEHKDEWRYEFYFYLCFMAHDLIKANPSKKKLYMKRLENILTVIFISEVVERFLLKYQRSGPKLPSI